MSAGLIAYDEIESFIEDGWIEEVLFPAASVPATAGYFAWGRFRYFRLGATATWRRDMRWCEARALHEGRSDFL